MVWPREDALPRIEYVKSFTGPKDLGIPAGDGLFSWMKRAIFGGQEPRMRRPVAVVRTPGGTLYVADAEARGVHRFDTRKKRYRFIQGEGGTPFPAPVGLARGEGERVYLVDSYLKGVFLISPDRDIARPVPLDAPLLRPTAMAIDPGEGTLFVVDTKAHQIKVFDGRGKFRASVGRRGKGPGEFNFPTAIWRDTVGRLYITDALNFRIEVFDASLHFLQLFGRAGDATGYFSRPKGIATDDFGHIYVVDALFHAVQIFDLSGKFLLSFGEMGNGPGTFWLPSGIFVTEEGEIYVADTYNRRIQVFRYIGERR